MYLFSYTSKESIEVTVKHSHSVLFSGTKVSVCSYFGFYISDIIDW